MQLPKLSIKNYQFTLIIFFLITIAGIYSYLTMPRTENPEISIPGANVIVVYPGTNATDMEQLVALPIEDVLNELDDIKKIETTLQDGLALISIEFVYGSDSDEKYDKVTQKINSVRNELPEDIYKLEVKQWTMSDVVMIQLAMLSDSSEYSVLNKQAENLKKELKKVSGVRKVEINACPQQEIRISMNTEKMTQMNISIDHIINAIKMNNANIPGGSVKLGNKSFGIKTSGSYKDLEEIRNTVVNSYEGRIIYLKNIADIDYKYKDANYLARYSGKRAIFISIMQKEGQNVFNTTKDVKERIEHFEKDLGNNINLNYVFDQSNEVSDRVNNFQKNLLQGIFLVAIIIFLVLGYKSAIIVIIAIPLSIITGLAFVDWAGFGLEQMSIAGLVVVLGLLVDNSIVMTENINRFLDKGYSPSKAAIKGASEIGWPIVSATITTLLAFIPIMMMPDTVGEFIRSLPVTIIAVLSVSLIIALSLTPLIAAKLFKGKKGKHSEPKETKKQKERLPDRILKRFISGPYRKTLHYALNRKSLVIGTVSVVFIGSLAMFSIVGVSFFPKAEKPQFRIEINLPEGTNINKTSEITEMIESTLDTINEIDFYATNIGHGNPRIYYNVWPKNFDEAFAEIYVRTKEVAVQKFDSLINTLRETFSDYSGAEINVKEYEQGVPIAAPIMVYIEGDDLEKLKKISSDVETLLKQNNKVINIDNQLARNRTDIFININKDKASMFGVPVFEIEKTIRACVSGLPISKYRDKSGDEYDIVIRLPFDDKINMSDFDKIYVKSLSGSLIQLDQLAKIEFKKASGIITRYNFNRTAVITADMVKGANLDEILNPVIEQLDKYDFPTGYDYRLGGEIESREESFGGMQIAILIALISIFAVLVLQFKSFIQPLIIFAAIPLALIGSVWALFITGYTFSFTAFIGITSLIGIVINNSIILVDYTNRLRNEGKSIIEAIKTASETRFTPIILTSLTTIGGLLPLTLQGGTMWAPMGWAIIGGLLVSTVLTLIIVPVLYKLLTKEKQIF